MRSFTPPLLIVTRVVLPLGFPLLTLPMTGLDVDLMARHIVFFGLCGAAMGLAIDRRSSHQSELMRSKIAANLREFAAKSGVEPEQAGQLNLLLDQWEGGL